jgi:uncharacterized protein YprB with RNaseH-like and TPR domain
MLRREKLLEALATLRRGEAATAPPTPPAETVRDTNASPPGAEPEPSPDGAAGTESTARENAHAIAVVLGGQWVDTPHGPAFVRETVWPLDHRHGRWPLGAPLDVAPETLAAVWSTAQPPSVRRLGFLDTETTGLAGGTGTYVFLAGLGTFEDHSFRLRQYFLPSLDGERAMLSLLFEDIERLDGVITYNGRSFDMPLLEARRTLSRLRETSRDPAGARQHHHFDLLRAVRRIYRHRFPSCALIEAETRLIGHHRSADVAGALIPTLYFEYIRAGRMAPLRDVFRHNAIDILSLASVLAALASLFAAAGAGSEIAVDDALALARWWELEGDPRRAEALYRSALDRLEPHAAGSSWLEAARRHAAILRSLGDRDGAARLWARLWEQGDLRGGVELAKHFEHAVRDLPRAEAIALGLLARWPDRDAGGRKEVVRRLERIRRKHERFSAPRQAAS